MFSGSMKKATLTEDGKKKLEVATCMACSREFFYGKGEPEVGVEELWDAKNNRHKTPEEISADKVKLVHFKKDRCLCHKCLKKLSKALDEEQELEK